MFLALIAIAGTGADAPAQSVTTIKTDASWGRTAQTLNPNAANTVVAGNRGATYAIPGNVYTITEAQGKLAGSNLFHSFESFSVGSGDAAVFTTTTPTLNNVISRVSGNSPTTINGLLALVPAAGSNPNFFFVNPNGITFGAGAQVDVPAAFHVSTADNLRFADGTVFRAGNGSDSTLTIAPPEAFGFLGRASSASIRVDNRDVNGLPSGLTNISGIGSRLTLTAYDIQLSSATISVPNGDVLLVATGRDPLEVNLDGTSIHAFSGAIAMTNATLATSGTGSIRLLGGPMSLTEGSRIASNQGAQSSVGSIALQSTADIILAGSFVRSFTSGSNAGSPIVLDAAGQIAISGGGQITSLTQSSAPGGSISLRGKSVSIDGIEKSTTSTGIISQAQAGLGNTGPISIRAVEEIRIEDGGVVSAATFSTGSTGPIDVEAASLTIDGRNTPAGLSTGIFNSAGGTGNAGDIRANVGGLLSILGGGAIGSLTFSSGSAASVSVRTGEMIVDGQGNPLPFITGIFVQTYSSGNARGVSVRVANDLTLVNGGEIMASTSGKGSTGLVEIDARTLTVNEKVSTALFTGVFNSALKGSSGNAGDIKVNVTDQMSLLNEGQVTSITESTGSAGNVTVKVTNGSLMVDGPGLLGTSGIFSNASPGASGDSGDVSVAVAKQLSVVNHGLISSSTWGGSGGTIKVEAGSLLLDAGSIDSQANPGSTGDAGNVNVSVAGHISILNGGDIATNTFSKGSAGNIDVVAGSMLMDARGVTGFVGGVLSRALNEEKFGTSSGDAGDIRIQVAGNLSIFSSEISSSTRSVGHAGTVDVTAGSLLLDNVSGIFSQTFTGFLPISQFGNAGTVNVKVANSLSILGGSQIASNTFTNGDGGSVMVSAHTVLVAGTNSAISAGADIDSSGQTGNVTVTAGQEIAVSHDGALSIRNEAQVNNPGVLIPTLLSISAPNITMKDSKITAESTGNVDASDIRIHFTGNLMVDPSSITTSANQGNGGAISIGGGSLIVLQDSQITTSVLGGLGNGGDISVQADSLVMKSGFIQANTAGAGASGGNVNINVQTLLPSGNSLFVGGSEPFVFQPGIAGPNVIQAAAPTGVSGTINATSPTLDVAGSLNGLTAKVADFGALGKDLCRAGARSSFTPVGRGGLRPRSAGMIRPEEAPTETAMRQDATGGPVVIARMQDATHPGWLAECRY